MKEITKIVKISEVTVREVPKLFYVTEDGQEFESKKGAKNYESFIERQKETNRLASKYKVKDINILDECYTCFYVSEDNNMEEMEKIFPKEIIKQVVSLGHFLYRRVDNGDYPDSYEFHTLDEMIRIYEETVLELKNIKGE